MALNLADKVKRALHTATSMRSEAPSKGHKGHDPETFKFVADSWRSLASLAAGEGDHGTAQALREAAASIEKGAYGSAITSLSEAASKVGKGYADGMTREGRSAELMKSWAKAKG